jgi:hypothetical protein
LFFSDLEDFFELMSTLLLRHREASNRVAPVRELFAHVAQMRQLHAALIAADKLRDFLEMGQEYFARAIDRRLGELTSSGTIAPAQRTAIGARFRWSFAVTNVVVGRSRCVRVPLKRWTTFTIIMVWSGVAARSASSGPTPVT